MELNREDGGAEGDDACELALIIRPRGDPGRTVGRRRGVAVHEVGIPAAGNGPWHGHDLVPADLRHLPRAQLPNGPGEDPEALRAWSLLALVEEGLETHADPEEGSRVAL